MREIHELAVVSPDARVGVGVTVGPFSVIHSNVEIGDGTSIASHCVIGQPTQLADGAPLRIGANSTIRSHCVLYEGSTFGDRLETGHHVTIREGVTAGENLRVGTLSDLQGNTTFGDFVRLHSNVHVGMFSNIGSFVWIYPYVVLTNDPHPPSDGPYVGVTVEDFAVVSTLTCVAPGITIGRDAVVGASSMVTKDVQPGEISFGVPARSAGPASRVRLRDGTDRPAYPWRTHFRRGYPDEVTGAWSDE